MLNGLVTPMAKQPFNEHQRPTTVRDLNDQMRRRLPNAQFGSRIVLTRGVRRLDDHGLSALIASIRDFDDFNSDNDPYEEHDFGSIQLHGRRYFWKIDAYDGSMEFGSLNPLDPSVTTRVLTIMRADEY